MLSAEHCSGLDLPDPASFAYLLVPQVAALSQHRFLLCLQLVHQLIFRKEITPIKRIEQVYPTARNFAGTPCILPSQAIGTNP